MYFCLKDTDTEMESKESKELKLLFIQEELSQHGEWLVMASQPQRKH